MGRIAVILVAVICAPVLLAQQSAPSFEVASVKPSAPGASLRNPGELLPGGRWTIQGAPLAFILRVAFDLRADQLSGGPPWIHTERFDINARAAGDRPRQQMLLMVQSLLADRFKLKVHLELRALDVHAMVLAKEGQLGRGLRPSQVDCESDRIESPPPPPGQVQRPVCGVRVSGNNGLGQYQLRAGGTTLSALITVTGVRSVLGSTVLDRTGLSGTFDIDLDYIPQEPVVASQPAVGLPIIAAFEQQLGLKFERRRETTEVLVIDSVARPTPD